MARCKLPMDALTAALHRYWGVSAFRPLQREAVVAFLEVHARACVMAKCAQFLPIRLSNGPRMDFACREGMCSSSYRRELGSLSHTSCHQCVKKALL